MNPYLPLPSLRRRDRARRRVGELIGRLVRERRAGVGDGEDFLQTLLEARYSDGSALDDEIITGLLLAIVFAGQHTSAILSTWTGLLLFQHPEHLDRLRAEQAEVFGTRAEMSLPALDRLEMLERCIKEAERMHPPLVVLMRKILRDFAYGDCVVPAGELALVSPAVSHRLPEVFRDADRYDPDRFGPARQEDRRGEVQPDRVRRRAPSVHRVDLRLSANQGDLVHAAAALRLHREHRATGARLFHVRRRSAAAVPGPLPAPRGRHAAASSRRNPAGDVTMSRATALYDVCIVGAGPVGATCAWYLARQGRRVLLLDKARFPRDKLCGDAVTAGAQVHLDRMGVLPAVLAAQEGLGAAAGGFVSPSGARAMGSSAPRNGRALVIAIKRVVLDHRIARAAVEAGAELAEASPVATAEFSAPERAWTISVRSDPPRAYRARVLVAADGALSRLARSLGIVTTPPDAVCSRAYVRAGTDRCTADGLVFYPRFLLPGYCGVVREADGDLNFCCYVIPGGSTALTDLRAVHEWLVSRSIPK